MLLLSGTLTVASVCREGRQPFTYKALCCVPVPTDRISAHHLAQLHYEGGTTMSVPHSFWTLGLVRDAVPWEALPLTGLAGSFIPVETTASHSYGDLRNRFGSRYSFLAYTREASVIRVVSIIVLSLSL